MRKMNHKALGICFCLPMALTTFFTYSSCSKSAFVFYWQGEGDTFEIKDYKKFPSQTVSSDQILSSYLHKTNTKNMICQDVIHKMNHDWSLWSSSQILQYKMSANVKGTRLSWDLQILDEQNNLLLWWTIKQLEYTWLVYGTEPYQQIQIAPKNVTCFGSTYVINEEFWHDVLFDMVIKHRESKDQPFDYAHEFSFKTTDDSERWALNEVIEYIIITPFYYEGVVVEES